MSTILRYTLAALVSGVIAGMFLVASLFQHRMAEAQRELAALNLSGAASAYEQATQYLESTALSRWLFDETRAEVVAKRAAVRYWQADYDGLVAEYANVGSSGTPGTAALGLTVANAAYRAGQHSDATRQVDAAFNYEYAIRLRDELAASDERTATPARHPFGRQGSQPLDMEWDATRSRFLYQWSTIFVRRRRIPRLAVVN